MTEYSVWPCWKQLFCIIPLQMYSSSQVLCTESLQNYIYCLIDSRGYAVAHENRISILPLEVFYCLALSCISLHFSCRGWLIPPSPLGQAPKWHCRHHRAWQADNPSNTNIRHMSVHGMPSVIVPPPSPQSSLPQGRDTAALGLPSVCLSPGALVYRSIALPCQSDLCCKHKNYSLI